MDLNVTAAAGAQQEYPGPGSAVSGPRQRSSFEFGAIVVVAAALGALSALLVVRAERLRGGAAA